MTAINSDIKCLDTSAWLDYYILAEKAITEIVDSDGILVTSSLTLFEIKKRLGTLKQDPKPLLTFVKERTSIIVPGVRIAELAAELALQKKLGALDALIYASALLTDAELVTKDNDFRGLENVHMID